jgi:hypothetical protein
MEGAEVVVQPGTRTDLTMTIPSLGTLATSMCEGMESGPGTGTLVGEIGLPENGDPLPGVRVQVTWNPSLGARSNGSSSGRTDLLIFDDRVGLETASNPRGWYTACGVPAGLELEVLAEISPERAQILHVLIEPGEIRRLDFRLPSGG